ncbi:MAG: hypothetical protein HOW73_08285 [Polyangiaceae bacterium]|nr:hypothetical protein [Polyangiaceae bacterium]
MAVICTCERCERLAKRNSISIFRAVVFVSMFSMTLPYAWLLFVAGPGVVFVLPFVFAIGFSILGGFRDWAFPRQLCSHCGASLEHAPVAQKREARAELQTTITATP